MVMGALALGCLALALVAKGLGMLWDEMWRTRDE